MAGLFIGVSVGRLVREFAGLPDGEPGQAGATGLPDGEPGRQELPGYLAGSQERQDLSLILEVSTVPAYTPIMVLSKLMFLLICSKL